MRRMRLRPYITLTAAITAALLAFGCANDSVTAPATPAVAAPDASSQTLLGTLLGTSTTVTPLLRTTPLKTALTTSATIGPLGGILALPGSGLTVVVPPLAVKLPTKMSVTALAGSSVAYEFQPHGIKFLLPLVATQSLKGTQAQSGGLINPLSLFAGYFPDSKKITSVTELLNLNVNVLGQTSVMTIWHFSGYIIATGRSNAE
jgi:hypothetical protein